MPFPFALTFTFPPRMARPVKILGSSRTCAGVDNPITDIIVTRRDDAVLFVVQGVVDREGRPTSVTMGRQVSYIDAVAQEEEIPPFLLP